MSDDRPKTSTRDHGHLREQLEAWLGTRVTNPAVSDLVVPPTNGMSSETVLFDASWDGDDGRRVHQQCVLRLPPELAAEPVFPVYDMPKQFKAMELVATVGVPVPPLLWLEDDPSHLGEPFFVMGRVEGVVPPDVMPYTFGDNWFFDADPADQTRLVEATVDVIARIHTIAADAPEAAFLALDTEGDSALRKHVNDQRAFYEWVCQDGVRSPLIEEMFEWLDAHWPADEGDAVVSWGDSRVGNIMYADFQPAAVLDWEMAAHGPRGIDVGWLVFIHRFFQDIAEMMGLPGLPQVLHRDDVAAMYEKASGVPIADMNFYMAYAALRHAIVMFRITRRQVRFGEAEMPENPDHAFIHHATVREMIDGTYWSKL
jgi:aminoglycoside phosphotransferase (APT) family kinase protein